MKAVRVEGKGRESKYKRSRAKTSLPVHRITDMSYSGKVVDRSFGLCNAPVSNMCTVE